MDGYGGSISWMEFLHDAVGNHMDYMAGGRRTVRSDSGYLQGSQSIGGIKGIDVFKENGCANGSEKRSFVQLFFI